MPGSLPICDCEAARPELVVNGRPLKRAADLFASPPSGETEASPTGLARAPDERALPAMPDAVPGVLPEKLPH
jgi:hypothetical protein